MHVCCFSAVAERIAVSVLLVIRVVVVRVGMCVLRARRVTRGSGLHRVTGVTQWHMS
jgi:hypothetical protein